MKEKIHKRLSVEELRLFKGYEHYTDEQAEETINTLEQLCILFYKAHVKSVETGKVFKMGHQQDEKTIILKGKKKDENEHGKKRNAA